MFDRASGGIDAMLRLDLCAPPFRGIGDQRTGHVVCWDVPRGKGVSLRLHAEAFP